MTAREKAKELADNFLGCLIKNSSYYIDNGLFEEQAKQCALIAVDELIYETQFEVPNIRQRYWIDVKREIENL
jgi:hypothetical protein